MAKPPPTNAPSTVGALAGAFGAIEAERLLDGWDDPRPPGALVGRELYLDALSHQQTLSRMPRNRDCRFDHEVWFIEILGELDVGEVLGLGGDRESASLGLAGDVFAPELVCPACHHRRSCWKLRNRLDAADLRCPDCGSLGPLPHGFGIREWLAPTALPAPPLGASLGELGFRPHDVLTLRTGETLRHFEYLPSGERETRASGPPGIVVAGCGNIGSHCVPHLARLALRRPIGRVLLVDPDIYEEGNLIGQEIRREDLQRPKARVQAERMRAIHPGIDVEACVDRVEHLPRGRLRHALVIGALDSLAARILLNEAVWRVGSRWIDLAVGAPLLCRVNSFYADPAYVCVECGLDPLQYRTSHATLPCEAEAVSNAESDGAPSD